jgi:FkbM family methyltransferase
MIGWRIERAGTILIAVPAQDPGALDAVGAHEWLMGELLRRLIAQEEVDLVVDVGGNEGQFVDAIRRHGYRGRILTFEPNPSCVRLLRDKVAADPLWELVECALGSESGIGVLHVSTSSEFSSLAVASELGRELFPGSLGTSQVTSVDVRRLDEVEHDWLRAASSMLLKIDTQGHDAFVLKGAESLLDRSSVIVRELAVVPIYEGAEVIESSLGTLRSLGYVPVGFFPVARGSRLGLVEADGVFVRGA